MSELISFSMRDHLVQSAGVSEECLVNRCQGSGCTVPMDIPNETYVLVDMDSYLRNPMTKKCDFLFIRCRERESATIVAPIELKRGEAKSSTIIPQLRSGAKIAEQLIPNERDVPRLGQISFLPIAAYGGGLRREQVKQFRKDSNKVRFRQQQQFVKLIKCRTPISRVLQDIGVS